MLIPFAGIDIQLVEMKSIKYSNLGNVVFCNLSKVFKSYITVLFI